MVLWHSVQAERQLEDASAVPHREHERLHEGNQQRRQVRLDQGWIVAAFLIPRHSEEDDYSDNLSER